MLRRLSLVIFAACAFWAVGLSAALAAETVNQGSSSSTQYRPWRVSLYDPATNLPSAQAKPLAPAAGAPVARVSISGTSAAATALTAGGIYRVACTTDCFFRVGSGTPTAVTTDSMIFGPAVEYLTLPVGSTAFAFITSGATGVCTVTSMTAP